MQEAEKIRVAVIDDEPLSRELMVSLLCRDRFVKVVGEAGNIRQARRLIETQQPDLLLLDIEMPGGSGFDLIKSLQADTMPLVIFATAFDQYAVAAFDLHAVDYLLKPFDPARVTQSLERAKRRLHTAAFNADSLAESKGQLLAAIVQFKPHSTNPLAAISQGKLAITDAGATTFLAFAEIDWVDAAGDYMCVHSAGKTHVMRSTLKDLEEKLAGTTIVRVHRSTMVNLSKIVEVATLSKGERQVTLENGAQLKVSRNYREALTPLEG